MINPKPSENGSHDVKDIITLGEYQIKDQFFFGEDRYDIDEFGVVHHSNAKPFVYDEKYCNIYNTEAYTRGNEILQALRVGFLTGAASEAFYSINKHLDFGCGNGAFIRAFGKSKFGFDIAEHEVEGVVKLNSLEVTMLTWMSVSFWDALEHVHDPRKVLADIDAKYVFISLPWCHINKPNGIDWFKYTYKHRKPNEHLHHFNDFSLVNFMASCGYDVLADSNLEDMVRRSSYYGGLPNILTMAFQRSKK